MTTPQSNQQIALFVAQFDASATPNRTTCRLLVEKIVSKQLGIQSTLVFDDLGSPKIQGNNEISISYSHSKTALVLAINFSTTPIGIDTESTSRAAEVTSLKELAFSKNERNNINNNTLFRWCLKEAAVKQQGTGFHSADPTQFSIEITDDSYKLYLDDNEIFQGYFANIRLDNEAIVVCSEHPINHYSLSKQPISTYE